MQHGNIDFSILVARGFERARQQLATTATCCGEEDAARDLLRQPKEVRRHWLARSSLPWNPRYIYRLLEQSFAAGSEDPAKAVDLAELALQLSVAGAKGNPTRRLAAELQVEAWMHLANARRLTEDFSGAEAAWSQVERLFPDGCGDEALVARVFALQGALRRDQQRFGEAEEFLRTSVWTYEWVLEDAHRAGRTKLSLAETYRTWGRPRKALETTWAAAAQIDPAREPRLVMGVCHQLILCEMDLGATRQALSLRRAARPLYDLHAGPIFGLRADWLEGRLHAALKDWLSAATCFEAVRRGFLERKLAYDAALVSLDLALVYAENGLPRSVERLASEMYPVFLSQDVPREASAALLLFADSARRHRATAQSIAATAAELEALRRRGRAPAAASPVVT